MIEDTSFLIDLLNGDDGATTFLDLAERERRPEKISAITALELHEGIERSQKPDAEKRRVRAVLDSKHVIAADLRIMKHAGELSGRLISDGQQIDREDCIIAATAIQENEPVVTRNGSHFNRVPNLAVETY